MFTNAMTNYWSLIVRREKSGRCRVFLVKGGMSVLLISHFQALSAVAPRGGQLLKGNEKK
jgi:hypothetical protein